MPPTRIALTLGTVIAVAVALHYVPQALRHWIEPAWTMLALMVLDAVLIATLARRWGALRAAVLLLVLLGLSVAFRQNTFAALPSIAMNLLLATGFGMTLRAGRTPLLVAIASASHPQDVTPDFARYLRGLTLFWVMFFIVMATASLLLSLAAPFVVWSFFVNVLTWPITAAAFLLEWVYRRLMRRDLPPHTPLDVLSSVFSYRGSALSDLLPASRTAADA